LVPGWAEDARIAPPPITVPHDTAAARAAARPVWTAERDAAGTTGGLALLTGVKLFDRKATSLRCPGTRALAGEAFVALHPDDAARLGIGDGDLCEVRSERGALRLASRIWPGLHPGHAYVPLGFEAAPVATLLEEGEAAFVSVRALAPATRPGR
jgi:anaerobic selenocysteine-containing dehydrogenase